MARKEMILFVRSFDEDTHRTFKAFCAMSGCSIRDGIEYVMRHAMAESVVIPTKPNGEPVLPALPTMHLKKQKK